MEKILLICIELNFTPNTLGCYGLVGCIEKKKHFFLFSRRLSAQKLRKVAETRRDFFRFF